MIDSLTKLFLARPAWVVSAVTITIASVHAYGIGYDRGIGTDGALYALSGQNLWNGAGYSYSDVPNTFLSPLFPILIGLLNLLIGDLQVCAHLVLIGALGGSVFAFYHGLKNFSAEAVARIGVVLFGANLLLIRFATRIAPEVLLIFFLMLAFYWVSRIFRDESNLIDHSALGATLGLAYWTKPEGALYFWLTLLWMIVSFRRSWRTNANRWLVMTVFFLAVAGFQILWIHAITGKWEWTTYDRFVFRELVEPLVSLDPGVAAPDPRIEADYNAYIVRTEGIPLWKQTGFWSAHLIKFTASFLLILGPLHLLIAGWFLFRKQRSPLITYLLTIMSPTILVFFWYSPADRLMIMGLPYMIALSALAVEHVRTARPILAVLLATVFWSQSLTPIANQAPTNRVTGHTRAMGLWIREHHPEIQSCLIADRKPDVAFLAQARYFRYNKVADYASLIRHLKTYGVRYVIVDELWTTMKNPSVHMLLDGEETPDLMPIHRITDPVYGRIVLFSLK